MKVKIYKFTYPDTQLFAWRLEYEHRDWEAPVPETWWKWHRDYTRYHDALRGARALAKALGEDPQSIIVESA